MQFVKWMYVMMAAMLFSTLTSVYIFDDRYSGIFAWLMLIFFIIGTACFINIKSSLKPKE
ncbi:hypothetical protein [Alkalihalobacillus pseudalcaliphilus]|uniref:hypothetical protein n=1 Tax=Alkalihalobacillus pseudalcaliphilus TaxID=79884 RepID=UPI00064E0557|nr:hypothetical protein [Alkalihalobacillus pseudalcaliphilus]KMK76819.1 hypothetical protein AB990_07895 [Alkalihalobacillus pseudalcaliphilus]